MARFSFVGGIAAAVTARALLTRAITAKLRRDVARLSEGDYGPLLAAYADDAVLHFNEGPHRWSGDHRGKEAIERFLAEFRGAGLRGEIHRIWFSGPPWDLWLVARFDDESITADGERLYANRVMLVARTRWGKIVEHWDFYEDTERIAELERRLQERGRAPVT